MALKYILLNEEKRSFFMAECKKYFAAANTEKGFCSLFGEIFAPEELSWLYIIKGGPGTGKSTFMRGVGEAARERGFDVPEGVYRVEEIKAVIEKIVGKGDAKC